MPSSRVTLHLFIALASEGERTVCVALELAGAGRQGTFLAQNRESASGVEIKKKTTPAPSATDLVTIGLAKGLPSCPKGGWAARFRRLFVAQPKANRLWLNS